MMALTNFAIVGIATHYRSELVDPRDEPVEQPGHVLPLRARYLPARTLCAHAPGTTSGSSGMPSRIRWFSARGGLVMGRVSPVRSARSISRIAVSTFCTSRPGTRVTSDLGAALF